MKGEIIGTLGGSVKLQGSCCHLRIKSEPLIEDLRFKSEHPLEVLVFEGLGIDELVFMPES